MSFTATVVDPLTDPEPPGWRAFVAAYRLPPMWDPAVVREVDWCARQGSAMVTVTSPGHAGPVALFHARRWGPTRPGRFVDPRRRPAVALIDCHLDSALTPGFAFADGLDDADRAEACRAYERAVRHRYGWSRLGVAYRNLWPDQLAVVPSGWRLRLRQSPMMVLSNEWPDAAGYQASLAGKWRAHLRKLRRTVDGDRSLHVAVAETVDPQEACWLGEVVRRRYRTPGLPHLPRTPRYFRALAANPGMRFLTYRHTSGRLVAFVGFHDDGRDLLAIWWGARQDRDGGRDNLYFDQYRRLVEIMITTGRRRLLLGPGMPHIKARYGARPESRWGVVGR
jgi:hypothetical protein